MNAIKAIKTTYKGYRFRSRLEARWAVFFDALGIEWQYEAEGYNLGDAGWYLPDFWLPGLNMHFEVKGAPMTEADSEKVYAFASEHYVVIATGNIGEHEFTFVSGEPCRMEPQPDKQGFPSTDTYNTHTWLLCPICGFSYVHIVGITHTGRDRDLPQGDDDLSIDMFCEDGCTWNLKFEQRHGTLEIFISNALRVVAAPKELVFAPTREAYNRAINAARSARFEHGEAPRVNVQP